MFFCQFCLSRLKLLRSPKVALRGDFTWIGVKFEVVLKGIVKIKMVCEHYQTVNPPKREPQAGTGLFGVRLFILHVKFQFSKSIKSSIFHIFFNLTYPLRKNISFPKCPKITQKFTQKRKTLRNVLNGGNWRCLKRERDMA